MGEDYENGFYLAVVGDDDTAEPIRVQDGQWYSVGCADAHDLGSVEIIRELDLTIPTRAQREQRARQEADEDAWEERMEVIRQANYEVYRREFYRRHGRYPGHRRWGAHPAVPGLGDSCASEASQPALSVHDEQSSSPKPPVEGA